MTKSRKAKEFVIDGNKVRCVILLKGRQKQMPERGQNVMNKFFELLQEEATLEDLPKLENGKWFMTLKPKKK
jgi:translation initiation factor IF-3